MGLELSAGRLTALVSRSPVAALSRSMPWTPHQHRDVAYEWSLASGWVYLREVGAGKNYLKKWEQHSEPYTTQDANRLVVDYLGDDQAAVHAATPTANWCACAVRNGCS